MGRLLSSDQGQIVAARQLTLSLRAQRAAFMEKWRSDAATELVQTSNDLDASRNSLKKALLQKDLVNLTAPADAVVLKVGNASTGSVSSGNIDSANDPLFVLVPLNGPVEATINIDASEIGFISPGDPVEIKLDAYRYLYYGTAKGALATISKGSFRTDESTGQPTAPYYQARVRFTDMHLRNVPPNFAVTPGMTLVADIQVGHRSIISYLVESVLRTSHEAMREP
jgi:HlyD family type I secretion membrane fusion protein